MIMWIKIRFKFLRNILENLFLLLIGSLFIFSPFYFRLLIERLPRTLPINLLDNKNYTQIIIYCIICIVWVYMLQKLTRIIVYKFYKFAEKNNKILLFFSAVYKKSLDKFYDTIVPHNRIQSGMIKIVFLIMRKCKSPRSVLILMFFFNILPKIVFSIALFYDILIAHKFDYSYKLCILLLLPLIERFILFWLAKFWENIEYPMNESICLYLYEIDAYTPVTLFYYTWLRHGLPGNYQRFTKHIEWKFSADECGASIKLTSDTEDFFIRLYGQEFNLDLLLQRYRWFVEDILFPIAAFGHFYNNITKDLQIYFGWFYAILQVIIWSYLLVYSL